MPDCESRLYDLVFTTRQVAANFITFGPVTLAGLGVALPVLHTVLVRRRPLADLGLTTRHLLLSLALGLLLGLDSYRNTLGTMQVDWTPELVPLATMALAVGFFEAVFFRGWLQLRFEAAFGLLPGLALAALAYGLYHAGYGMTLNEMLFLFGLGLIFGAVFRLTRNLFILWPFYTPVGGLYTTLSDGLAMPFEAIYGFLLTLGLMAAAVTVGGVLYRRPPTSIPRSWPGPKGSRRRCSSFTSSVPCARGSETPGAGSLFGEGGLES